MDLPWLPVLAFSFTWRSCSCWAWLMLPAPGPPRRLSRLAGLAGGRPPGNGSR